MTEVDKMPIVQAVQALKMMRESLALLRSAGAHRAADSLKAAIEELEPPAPASLI
jgi:hypothetical protein